MAKVQVGINGFGRIGRITYRAIMEQYADQLEVKAINDLAPVETNAHLLRHDSSYGPFPGTVEISGQDIIVNGETARVLSDKDPGNLPWGDFGVDIVLECTGFFNDKDKAAAHLKGGAKKVIISAPAKGGAPMIVLGVNEGTYKPDEDDVISNASCTTNCLAPLADAVQKAYGIEWGFMTTIHSYTNDQKINDQIHKDLRRARAAAINIIPTSTGAASAIGKVIPELDGKLDGIALRVPTATVSCVDLVVQTTNPVGTVQEVNEKLKSLANEPYLAYTEEELVSTDFRQDSRSSIMDLPLTNVIGTNGLKVVSWYDNEWGYSCRLAELCSYVAGKM